MTEPMTTIEYLQNAIKRAESRKNNALEDANETAKAMDDLMSRYRELLRLLEDYPMVLEFAKLLNKGPIL